jgi:hypothetical protein
MHCIRIQYDMICMMGKHDSVWVCIWLVKKIAGCHITLEKGETIHLHCVRIFVKKCFTMMSFLCWKFSNRSRTPELFSSHVRIPFYILLLMKYCNTYLLTHTWYYLCTSLYMLLPTHFYLHNSMYNITDWYLCSISILLLRTTTKYHLHTDIVLHSVLCVSTHPCSSDIRFTCWCIIISDFHPWSFSKVLIILLASAPISHEGIFRTDGFAKKISFPLAFGSKARHGTNRNISIVLKCFFET